MWHLARKHPVLVAAFLAALALFAFFGTRIVVRALYWANPAHHQQPIEGWMTLGYIAKSWGIDHQDLRQEMGLDEGQTWPKGQPLSGIADDLEMDLQALIAKAEAARATLSGADQTTAPPAVQP